MLKPLTSFRFFAAMMVFSWHTSMVPRYYQLGYAGVSFFFVLSGFILAYTYRDKLRKFNWRKVGSFYGARFAKIYPTHLLTLVLAIALVFVIGWKTGFFGAEPHFKRALLLNLFLLQSYYPSNQMNFSFNGVAWSISDEFFFYSLFPFLILGLVWLRGRVSKLLFGLLFVVMWAALLLFLAHRFAVVDDWSVYIFPPARLFEFLTGAALGLVFLEGSILTSRIKRWHFTLIELAVLFLLAGAILFIPNLPQALRFGSLLIPVWCLLIYIFAHQGGTISKVLSWRGLTFLGEISFSFYMIHQLVIRYMVVFGFTNVFVETLGLVITLTLSAAIYRLYEEPVRKRLKAALAHHGSKVADKVASVRGRRAAKAAEA